MPVPAELDLDGYSRRQLLLQKIYLGLMGIAAAETYHVLKNEISPPEEVESFAMTALKNSLIAMLAMTCVSILQEVVSSPNDLRYLKRVGRGNVFLGAVIEAGKLIVSAIPFIFLATWIGSRFDHWYNESNDVDDFDGLIYSSMLGSFVVNFLIGMPLFLGFFSVKAFIEFMYPIAPPTERYEDPNSPIKNFINHFVLGFSEDVALTIMLTDMMLYWDPDFIHSPLYSLAPVAIDQLFREPFHTMSFRRQPWLYTANGMFNLRRQTVLHAENGGAVVTIESNIHAKAKIATVGFYLIRAGTVISIFGLLLSGFSTDDPEAQPLIDQCISVGKMTIYGISLALTLKWLPTGIGKMMTLFCPAPRTENLSDSFIEELEATDSSMPLTS